VQRRTEPHIQLADHQKRDSENERDPEAHGSKKDGVVAAILIRGGDVPRFPLEGF